jgi:tetratricopeptide (TPR) repeat protein/anti-sigma regulatory factor (Ser/Thr protein kinase)
MIKKLSFCIPFLCVLLCQAQGVDDLSSLHKTGKNLVLKDQYSKAIHVFKEGYRMASNIRSDTFQILFLYEIGATYFIQAKVDSSHLYMNKAEHLIKVKKITSPHSKVKVYTSKYILFAQQQYHDSAFYYINALNEITPQLDTTSIDYADVLRSNGSYLHKNIETEKSLSCFLKALSIYSHHKEILKMGNTYIAIANLFSDIQNYEKANQYYLMGADLLQQVGNKHYLSRLYRNYANAYWLRKNEIDSMRYYLRKSKDLINSIHDGEKITITDSDNKPFHDKNFTKNPSLSIEAFVTNDSTSVQGWEKQIKKAENDNDILGLHKLYGQLAWYYYDKKEYDLAEYYFIKELKIVQVRFQQNRGVVPYIYENLISLYEKQGKWKEASKYYKLQDIMKDSLKMAQFSKIISETEAKYQAEKKQQQIRLLEKENESKNKNLLLISIVLIITTGCILYIARTYRMRKAVKLKADYERRMIGLEMQNLRSQMNPHFIFNSLNGINSYIVQNKTHLASDYLTKFSRLIRLILENSKNETITLKRELETLRLYLLMESLRFEKKFDFFIQMNEGVDAQLITLPTMIIQPYVENAIWHGLLHKQDKGNVSIYISKVENVLGIVIEDNGVGRQKATEMKSKNSTSNKSYGMQITSQRITHLNKENSTEIVDLKDEQGNALGTKVILSIHLGNSLEE